MTIEENLRSIIGNFIMEIAKLQTVNQELQAKIDTIEKDSAKTALAVKSAKP